MAAGSPTGDRDDAPGGFLSRWSQRKTLVRQGAVPAEPVPALAAVAVPVAVPATAAVPPPVLAQPAQRPAASATDHPSSPAAEPTPAPPTLADVAALTQASDYSRFVAPGVDAGVKNAALKKLFTNPHFNIMDGLDTYIDDYGKPDPLPAGMLRQMAQSHALGLFADDPAPPPVVPVAAAHPALPADGAPDPALPADAAADPALPAHEAAVPPIDAIPDLPETLPPLKPIPHEDAALRLQPHDAAGPAGPGPGAGPHAGRQH